MAEHAVIDGLLEVVKYGAGYYAAKTAELLWTKYRDKRNIKKNNLDTDYDRTRTVIPILEEIRYELSSDRVWEYAFSNGEVTFSGIHMKKLSVVSETEHSDPLSPHFQLVSIKQFSRMMDSLYEAPDDYAIFHELNQIDAMANINERFGIVTLLACKVRDDKGRWIGLVCVAWSKEHIPSADEVAYAQMMISRVAGIK